MWKSTGKQENFAEFASRQRVSEQAGRSGLVGWIGEPLTTLDRSILKRGVMLIQQSRPQRDQALQTGQYLLDVDIDLVNRIQREAMYGLAKVEGIVMLDG